MEDLFYFTKEVVSLDEVVRLAQERGYRCADRDEHGVRIYNGGKVDTWYRSKPEAPLQMVLRDDSWIWSHWPDWQEAIPEPEDRARLIEYGPAAAFIISYRPGSLPRLRALLKRVLLRYGGWVGDDDWSLPYTADSIDQLEFQPPDLAELEELARLGEQLRAEQETSPRWGAGQRRKRRRP